MRECSSCQSCFPDSTNQCPHDGNATKATLPFDIFLKDRYRLVRRIGQRSVSAVYFAHDALNNSDCAIKIILPETIGDNKSLAERFLVEATATSSIPHPNIVAVSDSGMLGGLLPFIVMEFISGTNLYDELAGKQALPPFQALHYMLPICSGLAIAHRRDIVHGDLKPRSILIGTEHNVVKVGDFGMSLLKAGNLDGGEAKSSGMLRSPLYLAPEVWSEEETDTRSDIYSLGVILYQMLTGDVPFKGKSIPAIMKQHLINLPPPIAGSNGISAELEEVVMHALAKDPEERPATLEEFVDELQFVVGDGGTATIVQPKRVAPVIEKSQVTEQPFAGDMTLVGHTVKKTVVASPVDAEPVNEKTQVKEQPFAGDMTLVGHTVKKTVVAPPVDAEPVIEKTQVKEQPFAGDMTLVGLPVKETDNAAPVDMDGTIVLSKTDLRSMRASILEEEQASSSPDSSNLDMTIVPGMMKPATSELRPVEVEEADEVFDEPLPVDAEDELVEEREDAVFSEVFHDEPPRTISPVFLAIGVILIVVLIGVGVYYSRTID